MAETHAWKEPAETGMTGTTRGAEGSRATATDVRAEIAKMRSDVTRLAEAVGGTVQTTVKPMTRELEATVVRHPTMSVVVAAGVGLVLGMLMSRPGIVT